MTRAAAIRVFWTRVSKRYCPTCRREYRRTRMADPEYRDRRNAQQRGYHARRKAAA